MHCGWSGSLFQLGWRKISLFRCSQQKRNSHRVFFGVTRRISSLKQPQDHKFDREKRSCTDETFEVTVSSLRFKCISSKYIYWTLYDTLIILNVIDIYKWLRLSIHNQTNMYAACVWSPHICHCSTCLQQEVLVRVSFRISRELWVLPFRTYWRLSTVIELILGSQEQFKDNLMLSFLSFFAGGGEERWGWILLVLLAYWALLKQAKLRDIEWVGTLVRENNHKVNLSEWFIIICQIICRSVEM